MRRSQIEKVVSAPPTPISAAEGGDVLNPRPTDPQEHDDITEQGVVEDIQSNIGTVTDESEVPEAVSYTHLTLPTNSRV